METQREFNVDRPWGVPGRNIREPFEMYDEGNGQAEEYAQ